ncbi:MAG: DUF6438 domain-containing protein [Flavipsychrobacter sp.]
MIKRLFSLAIISTVLLSASCAQQKKATGNNTTTKATTNSSTKTANDITSVTMERTSCFGRCPAYKTEIFSDGTVKYTSRSFTKYEGVYTSTIKTKEVSKLFAEMAAYQIDTCSAEYESLIADVPGIIFHIMRGEKDQEIMNAHFGPSYLKSLAKRIDELATPNEKWKKISDIKN